jgi:FMN phosphatase YigB (HAD superfamily)
VSPLNIFLDDGGVITDQQQRAAEFGRLFADVGVQPEEALVVDDSADATRWAARLGARTILVSASPHPKTGATPRLESLAELPGFLRQWV